MADATPTPATTPTATPTAAKRIRVSHVFTKDTPNVLYNRVDGICKALDGNSSYTRVPVSLADLRTNNATYADLITAAQDGSRKAIAARNKMGHIIIGQVRQIASYVEIASNGDMATFLTSGFDPVQPRTPAKPLARPTIDKITHGKTGELAIKFPAVDGASHYEVNRTIMTNSQPGTWTAVTVGKSRPAFLVTGLTPGTIYGFQVRAYGTAGFTDWSDTATCMCT